MNESIFWRKCIYFSSSCPNKAIIWAIDQNGDFIQTFITKSRPCLQLRSEKAKLSLGREKNLRSEAEPQKQEKSDWKSTRLKQRKKTTKSPMILDLRILPRIDPEQNHKNRRNRTKTHPLGRETTKSPMLLDLFRQYVLFKN